MGEGGFVVCLEARPETIWRRLQQPGGRPKSERPLLQGGDPLSRIRHLKALRQPLYALADCAVHTDDLSPEQVAAEVVRAWRRYSAASSRDERPLGRNRKGADPSRRRSGDGGHRLLGDHRDGPLPRVRGMGDPGAAWARGCGRRAWPGRPTWSAIPTSTATTARASRSALRGAGFATDSYVVPAGETSKDLTIASELYDWLAARRAERGHAVVALGGGMVGDLAGFVAATYLRGMPVVQVADEPAGDGRRLHRRQGGGQSPRGQEPDRRLPPAAARPCRRLRPQDAPRAGADIRLGGGHKARPDHGRRSPPHPGRGRRAPAEARAGRRRRPS